MFLACPYCSQKVRLPEGNDGEFSCDGCGMGLRVIVEAGTTAAMAGSTDAKAVEPTAAYDTADPDSTVDVLKEQGQVAGYANRSIGELGDYVLLEEIARGGMGIVYRARQRSLGRIVALKRIRAGQLATEEDVKRFRREAEAAASLDHPGIVPIYEVGEQDGDHFFSMGFVPGTSLAQRLAQGPLPPKEAAEIAHKVAVAVAYAHQHGVIHRDLKPGNILIDVSGTPRVTDFGLAKRLESDMELTRSGEVLGTPSYMPPEQASGSASAVTPAADVYALGALLYALITGRPPFQAASLADILVQVREKDPLPPRQLDASLPKDLDTICVKCLDKDPSKRYESAQDLADELARFLRDEPIQARPMGRLGRGWKWCRRKPLVAGLIGAVILVTAIGFAGTSWQWRRALQNYQDAVTAKGQLQVELGNTQREKERAGQNLQQAQQVVLDFFTDVSESDELLRGTEGTQRLRAQLLGRARDYYETFLEQNEDIPGLQAELAEANLRLSRVLSSLGHEQDAIASLEQTLKTFEKLIAEPDSTGQYRASYAVAMQNLASAYRRTGQSQTAVPLLERAVELQQQLEHDEPAEPTHRLNLGKAYSELGLALQSSGQLSAAIDAHLQTAEIHQSLVEHDDETAEYHHELAKAYGNLGVLHQMTGSPVEAEAWFRKCIDEGEQLVDSLTDSADYPTVSAYRDDLAKSYLNYGVVLLSLMKLLDARDAFQHAVDDYESLVRENPAVPAYHQNLQTASSNLGIAFQAYGQTDKARDCFLRAAEIAELLVEQHPILVRHRQGLADAYNNLGTFHQEIGKPDEALNWFRKAIAVDEQLVADNPESTLYRNALAQSYAGIAILLRDQKQPEESIDWFQKSIDVARQLSVSHPEVIEYNYTLGRIMANLAVVLESMGNVKEAIELSEESVKLFDGILERDAAHATNLERAAVAKCTLGRFLMRDGQVQQATVHFDAAEILLRDMLEMQPNHAEAKRLLAEMDSLRATPAKAADDSSDE